MTFRAISVVHIHGHGIKLLQRRHRSQQENHETTSLHRFDRTTQKIRCKCLKILKHTHTIRGTQDLVCILVVRVSYVRRRDEKIERIFLIGIVQSSFDELFDLSHSLFSMCRESQIFLVTPKHTRSCLYLSLTQHEMKIHDLIASSIADEDQKSSLSQFHTVLDQSTNTTVYFLLWHSLYIYQYKKISLQNLSIESFTSL